MKILSSLILLSIFSLIPTPLVSPSWMLDENLRHLKIHAESMTIGSLCVEPNGNCPIKWIRAGKGVVE